MKKREKSVLEVKVTVEVA